ncbi:hypothetical protein ACN9JG_06230 [Cereibacter azotoformans]|uniref:hypothetical protein n=1 Tax=Cereibacter azotoformans TaxID=43057 RepID=UPI003B20B945
MSTTGQRTKGMVDRGEVVLTQATHAVAVASIISAAWIPTLKEASEIAGYLMPILGVIWLLVQISRATLGALLARFKVGRGE